MISKERLDKLIEILPSLLDHRSPNPDGSDYECCFCGQKGKPPNDQITHDIECEGIKLQNELMK